MPRPLPTDPPSPTRHPAGRNGTAAVASLSILALFAVLLFLAATGAVKGTRVQQIEVLLPPTATATVNLASSLFGIDGKAAPLLRLRQVDGQVTAAVPAPQDPVPHVSDDGKHWRRLDRLPLVQGLRLDGAGFSLVVEAASSETVRLREPATGRRLVLTAAGGVEMPGDDVYPTCGINSGWLRHKLEAGRQWLDRLVAKGDRPLLELGGAVPCPGRWPLGTLQLHALVVGTGPDGFWLERREYDAPWRIDGIPRAEAVPLPNWLRVGDSHWQAAWDGQTLSLNQIQGAAFVDAARLPALSGFVQVHVEPDAWSGLDRSGTLAAIAAGLGSPYILGALVALLAVQGAAAAWIWQRRPGLDVAVLWRALLLGTGLVLGTAVLLAARWATLDDAALDLGLAAAAWTLATLLLAQGGFLAGSGGLFWCATLIIVGTGVLVQTQLTAGMAGDGGIGVLRHHLGLAAIAGIAVCFLAVPGRGLAAFTVRAAVRITGGGHWMRWFGPAALAAVGTIPLMLVQLVLGGEQGIGGIQPAEIAKTVCILLVAWLAAWLLAILLDGAPAARRRSLRLWTAVYLVPIASAAGVLVGLHDLSPVLTLIITLLTGLLALLGMLLWLAAQGRIAFSAFLRRGPLPWLLGVVLLLAGAGMVLHDPERDGTLLAPLLAGTISERLGTYRDPDAHPISGAQFLTARDILREAPFLAAPDSLTGANGREARIPLVRNDFVGAFLIGRYGVLAGMAAAAAQAAWVAVLLLAGLRRLAACAAEDDTEDQVAQALRGFLAILAAVAVGTQWLVGWSNPLGLLPVMGQPMSWLAIGGSHLLAFALPMLLLGLAVVGEEEAR